MLTSLEEHCRSFARRADSPRGRRSIASWSAVVQFAAGDQSGHLIVFDGAVRFHAGWHASPSVVLTVDPEAVASMLEARLDGTHLVARGELTVSGDYYDMINVCRVALATRVRAKTG